MYTNPRISWPPLQILTQITDCGVGPRFAHLTRPRCVLRTSSLHFRIGRKILKRFKKKHEKILKIFDRKSISKMLISKIFEKSWFFDFFDFSIFRKNQWKSNFFRFFDFLEKFGFSDFSRNFHENLDFSKNFEINIFEIDFRSKIFNIFSWFFFKPL